MMYRDGLPRSSDEVFVNENGAKGVSYTVLEHESTPTKRMNLWNETKSVPVSKQQVWDAYKKVRSNHGSAGIDGISMEVYDAERSKHLYKLWNRLASGSYFPPAVKEVEIPKKDGKIRKLGIPTISDRVAQMVGTIPSYSKICALCR